MFLSYLVKHSLLRKRERERERERERADRGGESRKIHFRVVLKTYCIPLKHNIILS